MVDNVTELRALRVRLEEFNCRLDKLDQRLEVAMKSLDANSEVLGLFYEEKYGKSPNWKPRLFDLS